MTSCTSQVLGLGKATLGASLLANWHLCVRETSTPRPVSTLCRRFALGKEALSFELPASYVPPIRSQVGQESDSDGALPLSEYATAHTYRYRRQIKFADKLSRQLTDQYSYQPPNQLPDQPPNQPSNQPYYKQPDPGRWTSQKLGDYLAEKTGYPAAELREKLSKADVDGSSMHEVKRSDLRKWGLEEPLLTKVHCVIEALVRSLPVGNFCWIRDRSEEEFASVVDKSSDAYEGLKFLGKELFLQRKPYYWADYLGSKVLISRLEWEMYGCNSKLEARYLRRHDEEWERVSRYDVESRDAEMNELQEGGTDFMTQAYLSLETKIGATFLGHNAATDAAPSVQIPGQIDKGVNTPMASPDRPMPIFRNTRLRFWKHDRIRYQFPGMNLEALALVSFRGGLKAVVLGKEIPYATRKDVFNLGSSATVLHERLLAGDPQVTGSSNVENSKEGSRHDFRVDLVSHPNVQVLPLLFAWNYDLEVQTKAADNGIALFSWDAEAAAVDIVGLPNLYR